MLEADLKLYVDAFGRPLRGSGGADAPPGKTLVEVLLESLIVVFISKSELLAASTKYL